MSSFHFLAVLPPSVEAVGFFALAALIFVGLRDASQALVAGKFVVAGVIVLLSAYVALAPAVDLTRDAQNFLLGAVCFATFSAFVDAFATRRKPCSDGDLTGAAASDSTASRFAFVRAVVCFAVAASAVAYVFFR